MLQTNLTHVTTEEEYRELLEKNKNVMICCGRMGPMCVPVYQAMIELEPEYDHVQFSDMAFDDLVSKEIRNLPECKGFMGLPFTVYFKNGKVVAATGSIQTSDQIRSILEKEFS